MGARNSGEAETRGGAPRSVGEGPGCADGAMEDGTHWGEPGAGRGASLYVVWDMGMPWVGSEHRESGQAVGGRLNAGARGYVVMGPETQGACVWGAWRRMVEGGST